MSFLSSVATRLSLGAALIGLVTAISSGFVLYNTGQLNERVKALLGAEQRLELYSALSTQITTLAVAALDQYADDDRRSATLGPVEQNIQRTFESLRKSIQQDVEAAAELGLNEQSRRATRGIMLARMEATYRSIDLSRSKEGLQEQLNIFSTSFQPLLGASIREDQRSRNLAFDEIARIRASLNTFSLAAVAAVFALLILYFLGLVRPLISRINLLRDAATRIGNEDFSVSLPGGSRDEIGQLFEELNNSSSQLAGRKSDVEAEWKRLSDVIDEKTSELRAANAALAETDENRKRFFSGVSHEMRTPLTVIIAEAELGATQHPDHAGSFELIQSRAKNLSRRIDDLLRLARSESGELKIDADPFDLQSAVEIAVADTSRQTARAGITVEVVGGGQVEVVGDRNWTRQVISAAIENSVRHASGASAIRIQVEATPTIGLLRIVDNGSGIPENEQERALQRFGQGSAKSSDQGFGIGLSFAQNVMEAQSGQLHLKSPVPTNDAIDANMGTMLTLELPLAGEISGD